MTVSIEFDRSDMARLKRKLSDRRTKIGRVLEPGADPILNFYQYVGTRIETRARQLVPDDTGLLRSSIVFRFVAGQAEVAARAKHAVFVHQGSRPHWPPPGALAGWARRHGIPEFLAARSVAQHGTKAVPFLRDAARDVFRRDVAPGIQKVARVVETNWARR